MAEEKKPTNEELDDDQLDGVAGGFNLPPCERDDPDPDDRSRLRPHKDR